MPTERPRPRSRLASYLHNKKSFEEPERSAEYFDDKLRRQAIEERNLYNVDIDTVCNSLRRQLTSHPSQDIPATFNNSVLRLLEHMTNLELLYAHSHRELQKCQDGRHEPDSPPLMPGQWTRGAEWLREPQSGRSSLEASDQPTITVSGPPGRRMSSPPSAAGETPGQALRLSASSEMSGRPRQHRGSSSNPANVLSLIHKKWARQAAQTDGKVESSVPSPERVSASRVLRSQSSMDLADKQQASSASTASPAERGDGPGLISRHLVVPPSTADEDGTPALARQHANPSSQPRPVHPQIEVHDFAVPRARKQEIQDPTPNVPTKHRRKFSFEPGNEDHLEHKQRQISAAITETNLAYQSMGMTPAQADTIKMDEPEDATIQRPQTTYPHSLTFQRYGSDSSIATAIPVSKGSAERISDRVSESTRSQKDTQEKGTTVSSAAAAAAAAAQNLASRPGGRR